MKIEIARDRKTGFPCIRFEDEQDFVALFPITKLQAEEWVWQKGIYSDSPTDLINRLEVRETGDQFPKAVNLLSRIPISQQRSENLLGIVATNLSLWSAEEETHNPDVVFPTPSSEWGQLTVWLGGRVPRYDEWAWALDDYSLIPTITIIQEVLAANYKWSPIVERLLWQVRDTLPRDAFGLPFMRKGLYELIADPERFRREVLFQRYEKRPQVVGDSPIWPTLSSTEASPWRPLRQQTLPVVTIRLWYSESEVAGHNPRNEYVAFEVEPVNEEDLQDAQVPLKEPPAEEPQQKGWLSFLKSSPARQKRKMTAYVSSPDKMKHRCPFCHEKVAEPVFMTRAHFCCYEERVAIENPDGTAGVHKTRRHSVEIPSNMIVAEVSPLYLKVAQSNPGTVHTVALGGASEAGKTTWLMGFGGLLDYPDGNSVIFQAFPSEWGFRKKPCSISNYMKEDRTDRKQATEPMWLDGILPLRHVEKDKAVRFPILFSCSPNGKRQEFLPIIDDIAGELLFSGKMTRSENYPHVSSTADAMFFMPAKDINSSALEKFTEQMQLARERMAEAGEKALDLKKINLILVISKIDQLKHGTREEQELLERILLRPYVLPKNYDLEALKEYIEVMHEVHFGIEDWFRNNMKELVGVIEEFGSVRYCGLSAFGFQPIKARGMEAEYTLPFRPEPVRAADPIFWLMKENGLIQF